MSPRKLVIHSAQTPRDSRRERRTPGSEYDLYLVRTSRVWHPPTDVYELDEHVVIKVEIAGMDSQDLDITLAGRHITISGHRQDPAGKVTYHNMEVHYGEFRTDIQVTWPVDESAVEAVYEDGFLYVRVPKAKGRRVQIQALD